MSKRSGRVGKADGRAVVVTSNGKRVYMGPSGDFFGCMYVDEHGEPVSRTKFTHPYSYDGFVQWRGGENREATGTIYSDRLLQWDFDKHDKLCMKHFGDKRQYWNDRDPKKIEAFLRDWTEDQGLRLILIMEYCNQASGYPCWRFDYARSPAPAEEKNDE